MAEERVPTLEGFFTEEGGAKVLGSKCVTCGTPYFPAVRACHNPDCTESRIEDCAFAGKGTLWSYSVANFPSRHRPINSTNRSFHTPWVWWIWNAACASSGRWWTNRKR